MANPQPHPEQANDPFSIRIEIVTWNPKGSKGKIAKLQEVFSKLLFKRISSRALVCQQEVTKKATNNTSKNENCNASFHEKMNTSIFCPKSEYVFNNKIEGNDLRYSGRHVTHQSTNIEFILITFHGWYSKLKDEIKKEKLVKFIDEMRELAKNKKLVVIVGGDFNIAVIKWKIEIEKKYAGKVVVAPLYAGAPNRRHGRNVIDTFIAVYPDKNDITCKFDTPIPIYMFPVTNYIGDTDDENKFVNYPNSACPCCKVLKYSDQELQELKDAILSSSSKANFEESYKDNTTDAILPLWPRCRILDNFNHDPVMVTVELIAPLKKQSTPSQNRLEKSSKECQLQDIVEPIQRLDLGQDDDETSEKQTINDDEQSTSPQTQLTSTPKNNPYQSRLEMSPEGPVMTASTPNESQPQQDGGVELLGLALEKTTIGEEQSNEENIPPPKFDI